MAHLQCRIPANSPHTHTQPTPGYATYAKETIIACLSKYKEKKVTVVAVLSDCLDAAVDTVCQSVRLPGAPPQKMGIDDIDKIALKIFYTDFLSLHFCLSNNQID